MTARDAFVSRLRRARVRRGVSLDQIAERTKVSVDLWEGMERNDFSAWPTGIFARAYIRAYAVAVGADPDATVDEFCRWFPQGDRRLGAIIRGQAEAAAGDASRRVRENGLVGRGATLPYALSALAAFGHMFGRLRRTFGA